MLVQQPRKTMKVAGTKLVAVRIREYDLKLRKNLVHSRVSAQKTKEKKKEERIVQLNNLLEGVWNIKSSQG